MSERVRVPEPGVTLDSALRTLSVVKERFDEMDGDLPPQGSVARMFVQLRRPDSVAGVILKRGDLWINSGTSQIQYWTGTMWASLTL